MAFYERTMRLRVGMLLVALATASLGCESKYPGEPVGAFSVVGTINEHECGQAAVPAMDPLSFTVELRVDGALAFWRRPNAPLVSGSVSSDNVFTFRYQSVRAVLPPDPDFELAGCSVEQNETVRVHIERAPIDDDAGAGDAGVVPVLAGTHDIDVRAAGASNCARALDSAGGPFRELPCTVEYELNGRMRDGI